MTFEWDENKNRINKEIHDGISFEMRREFFWIQKELKLLMKPILMNLRKDTM